MTDFGQNPYRVSGAVRMRLLFPDAQETDPGLCVTVFAAFKRLLLVVLRGKIIN